VNFITHIHGFYKEKSVLSTGMGTDNVEILMSLSSILILKENKSERKESEDVRIEHQGTLQQDVPLDSSDDAICCGLVHTHVFFIICLERTRGPEKKCGSSLCCLTCLNILR
jgi:hypothetical protein